MAASNNKNNIIFDSGTATMSPLFEVGDIVYIKQQYTGSNSVDPRQRPYRILDYYLKGIATGGYYGADGTTPADSDGALTIDVDNVDGSGTPDTGPLVPWFYKIVEVDASNAVIGNNIIRHEINLKTLAGVKLVVAAGSGAWVDPS
jgi:hypothetical protein